MLNFDGSIKASDLAEQMDVPMTTKKINRTLITVDGFDNLMYKNNGLTCHENSYAVNIKSHSYPYYIKDTDASLAYDHCKSTFFDLARIIVEVYGFAGYTVEGKNLGWLKPIVSNGTSFNPVSITLEEKISFVEYIQQKKMENCFEALKMLKSNLEKILTHSSTLDEVNNNLERFIEGK